MVVAFSSLARIGGNVRPFIPRLRYFENSSRVQFHYYAGISPQWLSELRRLRPKVPWQVTCELVSEKVPTLCVDSGIAIPLRLRWVKGVFRCNLPPALLAEWPGSFTCHCGNTGVERIPSKNQHTKLTQEKKIFPALLPGFEVAVFWSWVRRFNQQATPAPDSWHFQFNAQSAEEVTSGRCTRQQMRSKSPIQCSRFISFFAGKGSETTEVEWSGRQLFIVFFFFNVWQISWHCGRRL